jgi:hypothetical protein
MSIFDEPSLKPISSVGERYLNAAAELSVGTPTVDDIRYLHMIFAQTGFPYSEVEMGKPFQRRNGLAHIGLTPGYLMDPETKRLELQGLPYGSIPRLLMLYICHDAKRYNRKVIDMNRSITSFLRDDLLIQPSGGVRGGLTAFKKQMNRVAATPITIGMTYLTERGKPGATTYKPPAVIEGIKVWDEDSLIDKPMWNTEVQLSETFFETILEHSFPLNDRAIQALRKSPQKLDLYFNLAQRLPRIQSGVVKFSWQKAKEQWGQEYGEMKHFKFKILQHLADVLRVYPDAKVTYTNEGLELRPSKPPIPRNLLVLTGKVQERLPFPVTY